MEEDINWVGVGAAELLFTSIAADLIMNKRQAPGRLSGRDSSTLRSTEAYAHEKSSDIAKAKAARKDALVRGNKRAHGPRSGWKNAIRVQKGSEAADMMDDLGKAYIRTAPSSVDVSRMNANQLKTMLGIVDTDPTGIRNLGTPFGTFHKGTGWVQDNVAEFQKRGPGYRPLPATTSGAKGVGRLGRRWFFNVYENSPGFKLLRKAGINVSTQEERVLRAAAKEGLGPQKAVEKLRSDTTGRAGKYAYASTPGMGGDLVRHNESELFKKSAKDIHTTRKNRGTGNTPKVKTKDLIPDITTGKPNTVPLADDGWFKTLKTSGADFMGKTFKKGLATLPVVAGIDDASVAIQDLKEGDFVGFGLHAGDAAIDTFIGPLSLLVTVPVNAATGAESRGVVSALAALIGIEESVATNSLAEQIFAGEFQFGGGSVPKEAPSELKQVTATYGGSGGMIV